MCGVMGAREYLSDSHLKAVEKVGFLFAITGNIPESSGLSSSSALVTAAVMATLVGYGVSKVTSTSHIILEPCNNKCIKKKFQIRIAHSVSWLNFKNVL